MTDEPARPLTERQQQVAELLAAGLSRAEIAGRLDMAPATVKAHIAAISMRLPGRQHLRVRIALWAARRAA